MLRSSAAPEGDRHWQAFTGLLNAAELRSSAAPEGDRHLGRQEVVVDLQGVAILGRPGGRPPQQLYEHKGRWVKLRSSAAPEGDRHPVAGRFDRYRVQLLRSSAAPEGDRHGV